MAEFGMKFTTVHDRIVAALEEAGEEGINLDLVRNRVTAELATDLDGRKVHPPIDQEIDELYRLLAFESIDPDGSKDAEEQSKLVRVTERGRRMRAEWAKKTAAQKAKDDRPLDPETGKPIPAADLGPGATPIPAAPKVGGKGPPPRSKTIGKPSPAAVFARAGRGQ